MILDRQVRQKPVEFGLGQFTGLPVAVEFEIPTNPVKIGVLCALGVVMAPQDFDDAFAQPRDRLAGVEAEWDATLWECDGHVEGFQGNHEREESVISAFRAVKRDGAASDPLSPAGCEEAIETSERHHLLTVSALCGECQTDLIEPISSFVVRGPPNPSEGRECLRFARGVCWNPAEATMANDTTVHASRAKAFSSAIRLSNTAVLFAELREKSHTQQVSVCNRVKST